MDEDPRLARAAAMDRARAHESARAGRMIQDFVRAAGEAGIPAEPLVARGYDGRGLYRTNVQGWYLKRDRSVAAGTDGEFYVMSVQGGLTARLRGAQLEPSDPPLELGRGGRDGESLPLDEAIAKRLAGGATWG
ncbi:hypothetical protein [Demequina sp. NBRC 110052]|uniref:hypothetical protein n=1 Tax=Demequina sp. NBRC 110052 TaxID=1570341 RepID=UPI00190EA042|nr:hypothetical protein [Demequina sp. NBRC 110052]